MAWLLDTNIVSELRKGRAAHPNVLAWTASVRREKQFLSVLSLGEIHRGIQQIRGRDSVQADALEQWFSLLKKRYATEILPVCESVAERWGDLNARRSFPVVDGLLAATARVHHLRIATRNTADFSGAGVEVHNPFTFQG